MLNMLLNLTNFKYIYYILDKNLVEIKTEVQIDKILNSYKRI